MWTNFKIFFSFTDYNLLCKYFIEWLENAKNIAWLYY